MNPAPKLGGFAALLGLVFAAAIGLGSALGPTGPTATAAEHGTEHTARPTGVTGLAVSESGYTLRVAEQTLRAGTQPFSFVITGPDGQPLRRYDRTHERELHLVVVRRDLSGFQHVHPARDEAGTWTIPLTLTDPGPYRVYADFAPAGMPARTLGVDVTIPGTFEPAAGPDERTRAASVDGYVVTRTGDLLAGEESELRLSVARDGRPVTDLQPYLGAYGHLVVLREGDLAYLHVHPTGSGTAGPEISFATTVPSEGRYRAFLDFQHAGTVRTATWALSAGPGGQSADRSGRQEHS